MLEVKVKVLVAQLCPTLCNPMDCNRPGSSVHGVSQALEWVAISFFRGSSQIEPAFPVCPTLTGRFFTVWATREALSNAWLFIFFIVLDLTSTWNGNQVLKFYNILETTIFLSIFINAWAAFSEFILLKCSSFQRTHTGTLFNPGIFTKKKGRKGYKMCEWVLC